MRGEHRQNSYGVPLGPESSPHARGAQVGRARLAQGGRIIPAYAESARPPRRRGGPTRNHPRIRGEHQSMREALQAPWGSSPRAREAQRREVTAVQVDGIIPACAGNTPPAPSRPAPWGDYPRMRGEHVHGAGLRGSTAGSSPHARGARVSVSTGLVGLGIIPACAGSTRCLQRRPSIGRDHPRMRGEHPSGSIPSTVQTGIIPACAGSTTA